MLKCTIEKFAIIRAPSIIPKATKREENPSDIYICSAYSVKSQTDQNPDPLWQERCPFLYGEFLWLRWSRRQQFKTVTQINTSNIKTAASDFKYASKRFFFFFWRGGWFMNWALTYFARQLGRNPLTPLRMIPVKPLSSLHQFTAEEFIFVEMLTWNHPAELLLRKSAGLLCALQRLTLTNCLFLFCYGVFFMVALSVRSSVETWWWIHCNRCCCVMASRDT